MTTNTVPSTTSPPDVTTGAWRLDPARSSVEFHVRHFYGLMTVKGRFANYEGTLTPAQRSSPRHWPKTRRTC